MHTIRVHTAQNVDIEYAAASVGDRILAALIDYLLIAGLAIGTLILSTYIIEDVMIVFWLLLGAGIIFYDLLCEVSMGGQSFGKKAMKIKVVMLDGSQPRIGNYLLRWVLRLVDVTMFSGGVAVVTILINGRGQRIGDIAAGTSVVKLKEAFSLDDTIFVNLDEDYSPVFTEAKNLDEKTISVVREVLIFHNENRGVQSGRAVLERLKAKLEEKMAQVSSLEPHEFLETVLKDYNYYHGNIS